MREVTRPLSTNFKEIIKKLVDNTASATGIETLKKDLVENTTIKDGTIIEHLLSLQFDEISAQFDDFLKTLHEKRPDVIRAIIKTANAGTHAQACFYVGHLWVWRKKIDKAKASYMRAVDMGHSGARQALAFLELTQEASPQNEDKRASAEENELKLLDHLSKCQGLFFSNIKKCAQLLNVNLSEVPTVEEKVKLLSAFCNKKLLALENKNDVIQFLIKHAEIIEKDFIHLPTVYAKYYITALKPFIETFIGDSEPHQLRNILIQLAKSLDSALNQPQEPSMKADCLYCQSLLYYYCGDYLNPKATLQERSQLIETFFRKILAIPNASDRICAKANCDLGKMYMEGQIKGQKPGSSLEEKARKALPYFRAAAMLGHPKAKARIKEIELILQELSPKSPKEKRVSPSELFPVATAKNPDGAPLESKRQKFG